MTCRWLFCCSGCFGGVLSACLRVLWDCCCGGGGKGTGGACGSSGGGGGRVTLVIAAVVVHVLVLVVWLSLLSLGLLSYRRYRCHHRRRQRL